jgi:AraC family transcriptional regulator of adaptative response / DNA-3-methyladenine glycosylase II
VPFAGVAGRLVLPAPVAEVLRLLAAGDLALDEGADRVATRRALQAVPGLSPALIENVMLHALGDPDAFPATDATLRRAARARGLPSAFSRRADRWRPWRGYAAHLLWR